MKKKFYRNAGIFFVAGLFLAACQTTAKIYPLQTEDVRSYSLQSVNVTLPPAAKMAWSRYDKNMELIKQGKPITLNVPVEGETIEVSSTSNASSFQSDVTDTNEQTVTEKRVKTEKVERVMTEQQYKQEAIVFPLKEAIKTNFSEFMVGNRPVRVEVEIEGIRMAKSSGANALSADFRLIDVGTNAELLNLNNHSIIYQPAGKQSYYYGNPIAAILATAIDAAARAAISQAGKNKRMFKMSSIYAASVRDTMAPDLKPKN